MRVLTGANTVTAGGAVSRWCGSLNLVIDWTIMEPGKLMSTLRAIRLPDELVSGIEHAAVSQGKSPDQWVEDTLRAQLEWSSWQDLLAYGREKGRESGYTEEDVPKLVKQWRREQRG